MTYKTVVIDGKEYQVKVLAPVVRRQREVKADSFNEDTYHAQRLDSVRGDSY